MAPRIIISPDQVKRIIKTYKSGFTMEKTASLFNLPTHAVRKLLWRNNISSNKYRPVRIDLRKIMPEDEKLIIKLYSQGISSVKIAKEFNVTPYTILCTLKRNNVTIRKYSGKEKNPAPKKITKENIPEIIRLYQSGTKVKEISLKFDVCVSTIKNVLRRNGVYIVSAKAMPLVKKEPKIVVKEKSGKIKYYFLRK
jgi:DNA-binding NarL/FixJ family response regulator